MRGYEAYGVDHYRPKKLFPHLATEYLNLFYACNRCNAFKGSFWPTPGLRSAKKFIPNPCEHRMFDHLRYKGAQVVAKTPAGAMTVELLDLNHDSAVDWRAANIQAFRELLRVKEKAALARKQVWKQMQQQRARTPVQAAALESKLARAIALEARAAQNFDTLYG
jgi:hypothetical protein